MSDSREFKQTMRPIKFRAWDESAKKFYYWEYGDDSIGALHTSGIVSLSNGSMLFPGKDGDYLEQFTGLHDKNGKEIYEGDVVECRCGKSYLDGRPALGESITKYIVEWSEEEGGFWLFKISTGKHKKLFGLNGIRLNPQWYSVIGNIHEGKDHE